MKSFLTSLDKVINQLKRTLNKDPVRVGETYRAWKVEIANAITVKDLDGERLSNGLAEGLNNSIKTLIKDANGYQNFERFRKRILLVLNKKKRPLT